MDDHSRIADYKLVSVSKRIDGLARISRPRHLRGRICQNIISFWELFLANPRNFLEIKEQRSGGFAKTVRGFASANNVGG